MTGAEHQTIMAYAAQNRKVTGLDYPTVFDRVAEGAVGQADGDRVPATQRVEVAEGRAVGRPVPGDGRRAVLTGERRAGDEARALAQVAGRGPAHHDRAQADARDAQLGERLAVATRARQRARVDGEVGGVGGVARGRELERVQLRGEVMLGASGAQRAERLLPRERRRRVGQDQQPGHDERGAQRAPHRRRADSVPPREPGPA